MMTRKISVEAAMQDFSEILEKVRTTHDTFIIEEPGKPGVEIRLAQNSYEFESERSRKAREEMGKLLERRHREFAGRSPEEEEEIERIIEEERQAIWEEKQALRLKAE